MGHQNRPLHFKTHTGAEAFGCDFPPGDHVPGDELRRGVVMNKDKKGQNEVPAAVTVKMSKLTEGVGILFSGILTMLEALDPETAGELV